MLQKKLADKIKQLRLSKSWTQMQLSEISSLSLRTVQRIEKGETWSQESLLALASAFDIDVKQLTQLLISDKAKDNEPNDYLPRIFDGKALSNIIGGAHSYSFDYDSTDSKEIQELIASFFQQLQDYGDLYDDYDIGMKIEFNYNLDELIKEMDENGFWLFGKRKLVTYKINEKEKIDNWPIAIIHLIKKDNPVIICLKDGKISGVNKNLSSINSN